MSNQSVAIKHRVVEGGVGGRGVVVPEAEVPPMGGGSTRGIAARASL